jgi:anti-repressor protein
VTTEILPSIRKTGGYMPDASALSPELKLMNAIVQQMNQDALSRLRLEGEMRETKAEIQEIREVVEIKPFENWRDNTNKMINKICRKTGDYQNTRKKIYEALDRRAGAKVNQRLDNMRARAILAGTSRSKADSLGILDVIAEDKKLIEIYTAIVKEMALKKGVS